MINDEQVATALRTLYEKTVEEKAHASIYDSGDAVVIVSRHPGMNAALREVHGRFLGKMWDGGKIRTEH